MIARIWHGWTTLQNADVYEALLKSEIFPGIAAKKIKGYREIRLMRRTVNGEVEFMTCMLFDTLEDVIQLSGQDYERAYVPAKARQVLARFDERAQHYDLCYEPDG